MNFIVSVIHRYLVNPECGYKLAAICFRDRSLDHILYMSHLVTSHIILDIDSKI